MARLAGRTQIHRAHYDSLTENRCFDRHIEVWEFFARLRIDVLNVGRLHERHGTGGPVLGLIKADDTPVEVDLVETQILAITGTCLICRG